MKLISTHRYAGGSKGCGREAGALADGVRRLGAARWWLPRGRKGAGPRRRAGFTLVEALVAVLFMAIVVPVALSAIRVASMAGEASQRKLVAARIATRVINNLRVQNQLQSGQRGLVQENGVSYTWSETSQYWTGDTTARMNIATVSVNYNVAGRRCAISLSTLIPPQS